MNNKEERHIDAEVKQEDEINYKGEKLKEEEIKLSDIVDKCPHCKIGNLSIIVGFGSLPSYIFCPFCKSKYAEIEIKEMY